MNRKSPITFQTTDGQTVTVRRMLPADVNQLVYIYRQLSPESFYQRFREPASNLSPMRILEEARALAEAGYNQGAGFLAFVDLPERRGVPIAGARYICIGDDVAEVAITVCDAFQKRGVGARLLAILIEEALRESVRRLVANVDANNSAVLQLLNRYTYPQKREQVGSEILIEFDISQEGVSHSASTGRKATGPGPKRRIPPVHNARIAAFAPPYKP